VIHLKVAGYPGPRGLIPTTDRFGTALEDIVRCRRCGHMQLAQFPDEGYLAVAYRRAASDAYVAEEEGQRATARRILSVIERHARRGSIVDLGCWVGFLLSEAERGGWKGVGVEPSEFASAFARERLGLEVQTAGILEADLPAGRFDASFLGDVIEHVPDPGSVVDRVGTLLVPGGVLAATLPDAGSQLARVMRARWWSVIPTHIHYFTRRSMRVLLERHGFEVLLTSTAPKAFTVRYYLERLGGYSRTLARTLVATSEWLRVADRIWAPDLRDRMLVIAQRQASHP
jgi:SAM-dependent methyltransferase